VAAVGCLHSEGVMRYKTLAIGALNELRRHGASKVVASAWWGPRGPMITIITKGMT
jgi:hypothetical protein